MENLNVWVPGSDPYGRLPSRFGVVRAGDKFRSCVPLGGKRFYLGTYESAEQANWVSWRAHKAHDELHDEAQRAAFCAGIVRLSREWVRSGEWEKSKALDEDVRRSRELALTREWVRSEALSSEVLADLAELTQLCEVR